jgi:hypothetical protein
MEHSFLYVKYCTHGERELNFQVTYDSFHTEENCVTGYYAKIQVIKLHNCEKIIPGSPSMQ